MQHTMANTLTYFDMRGRAEASRLFLCELGIEHIDIRVKSDRDWSRLQPVLPSGALPTFSDGDLVISESHAILRFISRLAGFNTVSGDQSARVDEAHEALAAAQEELWLSAWIPIDPYNGLPYHQSTLPTRLERLTQLRRDVTGPYWFGRELTRVDCLAFAYLDEIDAFYPQILESSAPLKRLHEAIADRPAVKAYTQSSKRPAVFGIGKNGPKIDPRRQYKKDEFFECPWYAPTRLSPA